MPVSLVGLSAAANSIDPLTWQELVVGADFVGVVECEVAGSTMAKYRVVESWKGPEVGTEMLVDVDNGRGWAPSPLVSVGDHNLVTAYATQIRGNTMSWRIGARPVLPRDLCFRPDYALPTYQGRVKLPLEGQRPLSAFGSYHSDLGSFRESVLDLARQPEETQEARVLLALCDEYVRREQHSSQGLSEALEKAHNVRGILDALMDHADASPKNHGPVKSIMERGGMTQTLAYLGGKRKRLIPFKIRGIPTRIRERMGLVPVPRFGATATPTREENLHSLLREDDPQVRLNAAELLPLDREETGVEALRELAKLEGDLGARAAIILAGWGYKEAMPRALGVFAEAGEVYKLQGIPHRDLQHRLMALLSNAAKAGDVPQPEPPEPSDQDPESKKLFVYYNDWWAMYGPRISLHDPWRPSCD
ncbi:MAG TPA: hypothetical protein HPP77_10430 [Candidatus Hydrogenedentes bacterium]|nr:hypothetical protein [Candidatus Hydrogenedentota bacterium]HIJ74545.1 hypothetical protein [Candidatus Hydrogenedentota bacterium]